MRIACLQFTPLVGDVDNNLNRADAVLAKANQEDLDSLDLIVLPELAFSGVSLLNSRRSTRDVASIFAPAVDSVAAFCRMRTVAWGFCIFLRSDKMFRS